MELAGQPMHPPDHVYGFNFITVCDDAGNKIWSSKGNVEVEKGRDKESKISGYD